jgi:putative membrane protein
VTQILGTLIGRWYVSLLGAAFLWRASRHLGWRRTFIYAAIALAVGGLAENGSVHFGFPYTAYTFNHALRSKEIWLGDVPLMVPLSYTFMGYFGFAAGRMLASGPWRTRASRPWQEYLVGLVLTVWALWIFDPVSRLGNRWFVGQIFRYKGPGFWFGLPLGSQVGFTATAAILLGVLTWMMRDEPNVAVARWRDHPHLISLVTHHGQVVWLAIVAIVLGADEIGGSAALMWVPAAAMTAVLWSNLRPRPSTPDGATRSGSLATEGLQPIAAPAAVAEVGS